MKRSVQLLVAAGMVCAGQASFAAPVEVVQGTPTLDIYWSWADGTHTQYVDSVVIPLDGTDFGTGSETYIWGSDTITLNFVSGNVDPIITISAGIVDGGAPSSFSFVVSAPLAPTLYGLQNYDLRLSGSFADGGTNGGSVGLGTATVLPIANLVNGTLNGSSVAGAGGPAVFPGLTGLYGPAVTTGTYDCGIGGCTSFGMVLSFLGSGSNDALSFTGRFEITPVPVPGAVWLLGSAVGLLAWMRRRGS